MPNQHPNDRHRRVTDGLRHVGPRGPKMVDVTCKPDTLRRAVACGRVRMKSETLELIRANGLTKGSVVDTARIAGIMAAKRTSELIPLCHPLLLSDVSVDLELYDHPPHILVQASVTCTGKTGVEMEALTAVAIACLTVYDMAKAVDRQMVIEDIKLMEKSGGRSGEFRRGHTEEALP